MFRFFKKFTDQGAALITSLLILLVLVLLALSLLLQGNTEHLIALNEQDSQEALMFAEQGMTMARVVIFSRSNPSLGFTNFTELLQGPDFTASTADDHMIGFDLNFDDASDLNTGMTPADLNLTNEQTTTVVENGYEVFRRGIDTNGDGVWDGPRALVHVKVDDDYDEFPGVDDQIADTDKRIHATMISEYPIFVNASTGAEDTNAALRGVATRTLSLEFEPQTLPAISTDGSLTLDGNVRVCGECGDIHANTNITLTNCPKVCGDATASQTFSNDCTGNVGGVGIGSQPTITIPVINPYDQRWVPTKELFPNSEAGLPVGILDSCPAYDSSTHPGATKYFAFVADAGAGLIYKGYPDTTFVGPETRWEWFLVDDLNMGTGVQLDDCGQVAVVDATDIAAHTGMKTTADAGAGTAANDGSAGQFYGFQLQHAYEEVACGDTDASLAGGTLVQNNWTVNDGSNIFPTNNTIVLPGGCPHDDFTTSCIGKTTTDTTPDFDPTLVRPNDLPTNRGQWLTTSNDTWSPLYGAVVFSWGHVRLAGNLATLKNSGADLSLPNSRWRISVITTGYIDVAGTPAYATAVSDSAIELFLAGRDVELSGNANGSPRECGRTAGAYCDVGGTTASFAGFVGAHEQINMSGDTSLDGFMIAEDAANCGTKVNSATGISTFNGVPSVQYDCIHPPNPFATGIRAASWQEVQ